MIQVSDNVRISRDNNSWCTYPGVISGCEVYIDRGLQAVVKPGKLATLNGYTVEILSEVRDVGRILPTLEHNRTDYIVAEINGSSLYFRVIRGIESADPVDHTPVTLKNGILLAKLYVTYPCLSSKSIYVYNSLPVVGEDLCFNIKPIGTFDGVTNKALLPFKITPGYSLDLEVFGVGQTEGVDYLLREEETTGGQIYTVIEFIEAIPANAELNASLYLGKIKII